MHIKIIIAATRAALKDLGPVPEAVLPALRRRGHRVDAFFAEDEVLELGTIARDCDIYVLKAHDELCLSLAALLSAIGAPILNSYRSSVQAENKILVTDLLLREGLPVPQTWIVTQSRMSTTLPACRPLVLKPHVGGMGRSEQVRILGSTANPTDSPTASGFLLAQTYIAGPGVDLKVYVAGDQVFAVRKRFAPRNFFHQVERCNVPNEIEKLALRVGAVLGLVLFGLDIIESADGPVIVDVNYFPSYAGVPEAPEAIAQCIDTFARENGGYRSSS